MKPDLYWETDFGGVEVFRYPVCLNTYEGIFFLGTSDSSSPSSDLVRVGDQVYPDKDYVKKDGIQPLTPLEAHTWGIENEKEKG